MTENMQENVRTNIRTKKMMAPQIMKYIIVAVILAYIAVLMAYASGSSRPFEEVEAALSSALDGSGLKKMDSQMLKRNFGLNSADYAGVMYYASESSMSAEEVLLIRVSGDSQVQEVADAVSERISSRKNAFDGYAPEQVKLLEDAQQSVRGRYVFFAVSPDAEEYRAVFDGSL
mgnify:CR=1 FL=1